MSESNEEQKLSPPSEEYAASLILKSSKPSGIKPPSTSSVFSTDSSAHRVSRICSSHQKKPELPIAATPNKNVSEESEYDLLYERFGLGYRSSKSKSQSPDPFRLYKYSPDRKSSSGISSVSPDFFEATGRRSSSDLGADLTTDTDSFMIGNRVYVGGVKPGRITFIGEVHFAPGEWAGVVLDEPEGKNDGAVSGKRYFQCEPKKGIFSRLTRLTREPLSSTTTDGPLSADYSFRSFTSPIRNTSGNTSPTQSISSVSKTAAGTKLIPEINDRVIVKSATGSRAGILRYRGEPAFASGIWCGVEYEEPVGKNDGSVSGQRYFKCAPNHGIFVPEGKVVLSPLSRKMRLSRQNSQESLTSNITLGSLASTNTAKLRLNATQKRLSTLNKSPSATSTPKPSFSLQDILREKSNHIEQIMKERDIEREEMAAQTVLYQKNLNQYKEKITHLTKLLEDERKKSEDLQFTIDEAQTNADENESKNTTELTLREKIKQLEQNLKQQTKQGAGDFAIDTSQADEFISKLRIEVEELKQKLHNAESLKATLENEIQSLNEKITEYSNELELKSSANDAIEKVFKEEIEYLQGRVNDLEKEISAKSSQLENDKENLSKIEISFNEKLSLLQKELEEKAKYENLLAHDIKAKNQEIASLKSDIEKLASSDQGAQEIITKKDNEIQKLNDALQTKESSITELSSELGKNIHEVTVRDKEIENLQKSLQSLEIEKKNNKSTCEQHLNDIQKKLEEISNQKSQIDAQVLEISSLKSELQRMETIINESNENILKYKANEEALTSKVTDLSESKVKLENDLISKDKEIAVGEEAKQKLIYELEEIKKCMSGLDAEAKGNLSLLNEKDSLIENLTKDLNDLKETNQKEIKQLTDEKNSLEIKLEENLKLFNEQISKEKTDHDVEKNKLKTTIDEFEKIIKEKDARMEVMNKNSQLLNESKDKLEKSLIEYESKLNENLAKLSKLEKEHDDSLNQLSKLQSQYDETSQKLQEFEITTKKLQDDKTALEIDNKDLNRKLGAQDEKITQLTEQKLKLQEELDSYKTSSLDANSELKKLHDSLKEKQLAFENYQSNSEKSTIELQRRIDELENQRDTANQMCTKLKSDMEALYQQKIDNENSLNTDLQNIKTSTEEEIANLVREISNLRASFETERTELKRNNVELIGESERCKNELEAKIKSLNETLEDLRKELNSACAETKNSESRFGVAIDELKAKESKLLEELSKERDESDKQKAKIEELQAAKEIQMNEYEEKLTIEKAKIAKLEGELFVQIEQHKLASAGNEEKVKILDDIQAKCFEYEQKVSDLSNQIQNELSSKAKLENSLKELHQKLREIEEEQIDLVNKKEEYKAKTIEQQEIIDELKQRRKSLDEKLSLEKKDSELFKSESDIKIKEMQHKLNELNQMIAKKDFEKEEILNSLKQRDDKLSQLSDSIKQQDRKLQDEIDSIQKEIKTKDDEITKMANECSVKDELLNELRNTVENLKTCLNSMNDEKTLSKDTVVELNQNINLRDEKINELSLEVHSLKSILKEKDDQLKNVYAVKSKVESESRQRIDDLMEQLNILEEVKTKEFSEINEKLSQLTAQVSIYQTESESSRISEKDIENMRQEYLMKIRDLEMSETELQITNQTLKRQLEEIQNTTSLIPKMEAGDQDLVEHIEFLNSIIADMHKKNLKLTKQVHSMEVGSSKSNTSFKKNDFDMKFLEKKQLPPPRMYCDICEIFDAHETEDCPTQCSAIDPDAPAAKREEKKERKKPPPRKYCDFCEIFDAHETEECPNNDETF